MKKTANGLFNFFMTGRGVGGEFYPYTKMLRNLKYIRCLVYCVSGGVGGGGGLVYCVGGWVGWEFYPYSKMLRNLKYVVLYIVSSISSYFSPVKLTV